MSTNANHSPGDASVPRTLPKRLVQQTGLGSHDLSFLLTVLIAIVTALLCALLPLGPAIERVAGSAFDPSTTAVSLQPRSDQASYDEEVIRKPRDVPNGEGAWIADRASVSHSVVALPPLLDGVAASFLAHFTDPSLTKVTARFYARAPTIF